MFHGRIRRQIADLRDAWRRGPPMASGALRREKRDVIMAMELQNAFASLRDAIAKGLDYRKNRKAADAAAAPFAVDDEALVFSLQSDEFGGFLNGEPCVVVEAEDADGLVKVMVVRNIVGTYEHDPAYAVYPEQLRRIGQVESPRARTQGEVVRVYSAQSFFGGNRYDGQLATVVQKQIGASVLVEIPGREHSYEVYAHQLRSA